MKRLTFLALLLLVPQLVAAPANPGERRMIAGVIYFTNNTPSDINTFPIELFSRDEKILLASARPDAHHSFSFSDIEPGEYILKITRPKICTLRYRMDLRTESKPRIRVIMDAACAHDDGKIHELDEN